METAKRFENYPAWIVLVSNLLSVAIYALGVLILSQAGLAVALLYLLGILAFEYRLIKNHCVNCYYWGKTCGFGKGRLSAWFFKRGDSAKFCAKAMTWRDLLPDIFIAFTPVVVGLALLIMRFEWWLLGALLALLFLASFGNGFVRGRLACKYCRQRDLGCPAEAWFKPKAAA